MEPPDEKKLERIRKDVALYVGKLEQELRDRDRRLELVEKELTELRAKVSNGSHAASWSEQVDMIFQNAICPTTPSPDVPSAVRDASSASHSLVPVPLATSADQLPSANALPVRPHLSSRLSASGTDFSSYSPSARLSRISSGAVSSHGTSTSPPTPVSNTSNSDPHLSSADSITPVPKEAVEKALAPLPKQTDSPGLKNRKLHLNDMQMLSVKQRRLLKQTSHNNTGVAESGSRSDMEISSDQQQPTAAAGAEEQQQAVSPQPSPQPSPSTNESRRRLSLTETRKRGDSAGASAQPNLLPLPSADVVKEALMERQDSSTSQHSLAAYGRRRSASNFFQKFKSAFPNPSDRRGEANNSMKDFAQAVDGGLANHNLVFEGRCMWSGPVGRGYTIEVHMGDGMWTFASDTLKVPLCYVRAFDRRFEEPNRPKLWVAQRQKLEEAAVIFAVPDGEDMIAIVVFSEQGIQKTWLRCNNISVMSPKELSSQLLLAACPYIYPENSIRVRGPMMEMMRARAREYDAVVTPSSFDVTFIDYTSAPLSPTAAPTSPSGNPSSSPPALPSSPSLSSVSGRTSRQILTRSNRRTVPPASRILSAITKEDLREDVLPDTVTYAWNDVTLHFHSSTSALNSSSGSVSPYYPVVVVMMTEESGSFRLPPVGSSDASVFICVREISQQKYELSCCFRSVVYPFGPPFFHQSVKEKSLQALVTAKILHAYAAIRSSLSGNAKFAQQRQESFARMMATMN